MTANAIPLQKADPGLAGLLHVFVLQKEAFTYNRKPSAAERIAHLDALKRELLKYQDNLIEAIGADFGHRSTDKFSLSELLATLDCLKYCRQHVRAWMQPQSRRLGALCMPARARVDYQPLGVIGIVSAWNCPLLTAVEPLIYALAAGNRAMITMPDFTPRLATVFQELIAETFAEGHVAVFTGNRAISEAFLTLPFDQLAFTGSTQSGRVAMAEASKNLTPVLLELGGKSPAIVHESFPLDVAVERIAVGKCWNAGQFSGAPNHVYLPRGKTADFVQEFTARIGMMYPGRVHNPDYSAVINNEHYERIQQYLDHAVAQGADLVEINPADESFLKTRKMPVTLVVGVTLDMAVMQNEILGPALPILEYDDIDELPTLINSQPRPPALYYFDYDKNRTNHVIDNTRSGGVMVNDVLAHAAVDRMPFGCAGLSGIGSYHRREGFLAMSHARSVLVKSRFSFLRFILPSFNKHPLAFLRKALLR